MLTYGPDDFGTRTVTGTWNDWREQLPGLPDHPNTELTADLDCDVINTANEEHQGAELTVVDGHGVEHTELLSLLRYPKMVEGILTCRAYIVTAAEETRTGRCQVCPVHGELVKRSDASGITGWVCRSHDAADLVFA